MPWIPAEYLTKIENELKLAKESLADAMAVPPATTLPDATMMGIYTNIDTPSNPPKFPDVQPYASPATIAPAPLLALEADLVPPLIGTFNE